MKWSSALAVAVMVSALGGVAGSEPGQLPPYPLTPASLQEQIKKRGSFEVLNEITYGYETGLDIVSAKIASGELAWLKVAAALKEHAATSSSEWLDLAVAAALERAP